MMGSTRKMEQYFLFQSCEHEYNSDVVPFKQTDYILIYTDEFSGTWRSYCLVQKTFTLSNIITKTVPYASEQVSYEWMGEGVIEWVSWQHGQRPTPWDTMTLTCNITHWNHVPYPILFSLWYLLDTWGLCPPEFLHRFEKDNNNINNNTTTIIILIFVIITTLTWNQHGKCMAQFQTLTLMYRPFFNNTHKHIDKSPASISHENQVCLLFYPGKNSSFSLIIWHT